MFLTNRKDRGVRSAPPWLYGYRRVFSLFFLNRDLFLDVNDQNPKEQPSTFKIEAHRIFWKIDIFGENPTNLKIRCLEIWLFIQKRFVSKFAYWTQFFEKKTFVNLFLGSWNIWQNGKWYFFWDTLLKNCYYLFVFWKGSTKISVKGKFLLGTPG